MNKNYIDDILVEFKEKFCPNDIWDTTLIIFELEYWLKQKLQEVEQNSLKNFTERLRGDLILHPDLENLNEIITKRLDKIIKN